jgi:predicted nucleic acid-binding protein
VIYLDANVFVYAALNRKALGERSRSIIGEVQTGKIMAVTSALSFDELVWAFRKQRGESDGISAGEIFLNMPRLEIMDVRQDLLSYALS